MIPRTHVKKARCASARCASASLLKIFISVCVCAWGGGDGGYVHMHAAIHRG